MCAPAAVLLPWAIGAMAVGTGVSVYGQVQAGRAQRKVANYNARVQEIAARDAEHRGRIEEGKQREGTARLLAAQRARLAAGGVDIDSGSALELLTGTAEVGEMDALTIRSNAAREVWGLRTGAGLTRAEGQHAYTAGVLGGISTAASGAAQTFGFWKSMKS